MSEYRKKKMPNENIPSLECGAEIQISTINNQNTEKKVDKICAKGNRNAYMSEKEG